MPNTLTHKTHHNKDGEVVIDQANRKLNAMVGNTLKTISQDGYTKAESDSVLMPTNMIPVTRVGDSNYVPMDIKGDFRSSTSPMFQHSYPLVENDGTITVLRSGYNGQYYGLFYTYSPTGVLNGTDAVVTDFQYSPPWLQANEYVEFLRTTTNTGFLAIVRNKTNRAAFKAHWIEHNGTLNAQYHTYYDVTDIVSDSYSSVWGLAFSPEANLFVGINFNSTVYDKITYTIFPNTRQPQSAVSGSQPAMPALSITWSGLTGESGTGTTAIVTQFENLSKYTSFFKRYDEVAATTQSGFIWWHSSFPNLQVAYLNGVLRIQTYMQTYFYGANFTRTMQPINVVHDYNVATKTLTPFNYVDSPEFQSKPWYFDFNSPAAIDKGAVPSPVTSAYKRNKFPIVSSVYRHSVPQLFMSRGQVFTVMKDDSTIRADLLAFPPTGTGSTPAEVWFNTLVRPPHQDRNVATWLYYLQSNDASLMAKNMQYVRFAGKNKIMFTASSKLAGEANATAKICTGLLDDTVLSETYYITERSKSYAGLKPLKSLVKCPNQAGSSYYISKVIDGDNPSTLMMPSAILWNNSWANYYFLNNYDPSTGTGTAYTSNADAKAFFDQVESNIVSSSGMPTPTLRYWTAQPVCFLSATSVMFVVNSVFSIQGQYIRSILGFVTATVNGTSFTFDSSTPVVKQTIFSSGTELAEQYAISIVGSLACFKHTNGKLYMAGCHGALAGASDSQFRVWQIEYNPTAKTIERYAAKQWMPTIATWWTPMQDIHEEFGLYQASTWYDSLTKTTMLFVDKRSVTPQSDRIYQTFDDCFKALTTPTEVVISVPISGGGFFLYVSEFPVFIRGRALRVNSQTVSLATWDSSPANKTFYVYVKETAGVLSIVGSTTPQAETLSLVYIGKVVTNDTLITSSAFDKVTRLDTYRTSDKSSLIGSSIPVQVGQYNQSPNSITSVRQGTNVTISSSTLVPKSSGVARITNTGTPTNVSVTNNTTSLTLTPTVFAEAPGQVSYNYVDDGGNAGQGTARVVIEPAPPLPALIYDTTANTNSAKSAKTPPGFASVFSSWDRLDGDWYYPGGKDAVGDAAAWALATNPDRVVQPNNTSNVNCFVSPQSYTDFEFETTLYSSNGDDDLNGVVVGFVRENGKNYVLAVFRNAGGWTHFNTDTNAQQWDFGFALLNGGSMTLPVKNLKPTRSNSQSPAGPGWGGAYTRVRVVRTGNQLKATCSDWSTTQTGMTFMPESEMVLDLTQQPQLARFKTSSPYGYATISQPDSAYYDTGFVGTTATGAAVNPNFIYDASASAVWKYNVGTTQWEQLANTTVQKQAGYTREMFNPETNQRFFVWPTLITGPGWAYSQADMVTKMNTMYPGDTTIPTHNTKFNNNQRAWYLTGLDFNKDNYTNVSRLYWRYTHEFILEQDVVVTVRSRSDDSFTLASSTGTILHRQVWGDQNTFPLKAGYNRMIAEHGNSGGGPTYMIFDMVTSDGKLLSSSHPSEWTLMSIPNGENQVYV